MNHKVAVVASGGNALIRDEKNVSVEDQYEAAKETCMHIADMIEQGWDVAIGHGNGPQVGFILRRSEIAAKHEGMHEVPLDVCGADTQGAIGYALQQILQNILFQRNIKKKVVTVITQMLVDMADPAFLHPTKPMGGFMSAADANRRPPERGGSGAEGRATKGGGARDGAGGGRKDGPSVPGAGRSVRSCFSHPGGEAAGGGTRTRLSRRPGTRPPQHQTHPCGDRRRHGGGANRAAPACLAPR
mgnify:CR=1 FL=1